jgi:hypothetical protein
MSAPFNLAGNAYYDSVELGKKLKSDFNFRGSRIVQGRE